MSQVSEMMEYNKFFNSLSKDKESTVYIKGSTFINIARQYNESIPKYGKYIELRREDGLSTSRRDFFKDILDMFPLDIKQKIMMKCKK